MTFCKAYAPVQARQHLFSEDLFARHDPLTTDAFTLYVKSAILLGKVKTFNIRFKSRYPTTLGPQGFYNASARQEPRATPEFLELDQLIRNYVSGIPKRFSNPIDMDQGNKVDRILYMAHLLPQL